jgi:hypothetical protein
LPLETAVPEWEYVVEEVVPRSPEGLRDVLHRWVQAGLLSRAQADAIVAHEAAPAPLEPEGGISVLAEALGYAGAALAVAGIATALGQSWDDLGSPLRVISAAVPTGLAVLAGALLRSKREPAFRRLMSLLWFLSIGGFVGTAGVAIAEYASGIDRDWVALVLGLVMVLPAFVLWRLLPSILQQIALLGGVMLTVIGVIIAAPGEPNGTAIALTCWALGLIWVALGWRGRLRPRTPTMAIGAVVAAYFPVVAAQDHEWLLALGVVTGAALMILSVGTGALPLLAIGTVTVFAYVTGVVMRYFSESLGVPLALVIIGAVFIALALFAARLGRLGRRSGTI